MAVPRIDVSPKTAKILTILAAFLFVATVGIRYLLGLAEPAELSTAVLSLIVVAQGLLKHTEEATEEKP